MNSHKLEIACFNLESAVIAQEGGADRVELCANRKAGGVTPQMESVRLARNKLFIALYVMIRPRDGNFVYSDSEFEQMKKDIFRFKQIAVDGFVFGILQNTSAGFIGNARTSTEVNVARCKELVELASPLPCTFHRAFDVVSEVFQALENVIECGFKTILTSGQRENAVEGIATLTLLAKQADNRISIMPGGDVRSSNISLIKEQIKASFYHSSAITDNSDIANLAEVKLLKEKINQSKH